MTRPPLDRMLRIHEKIKAGKFPNCSTLGEELEVSYKTIQRDIDFLRDRWELPIEYDDVRHGFFYSAPVKNLPNMTLSHGELVALLVAQKAVEQYRGTPFEKPIASAFQKLASAMEDSEGVAIHDLSEAFSFKPASLAVSELKAFTVAARAVLNHREVTFSYRSLQSGEASLRTLHPHHLGCVSDQWYLIGWDPDREAIRTFALARVQDLAETGQSFTIRKDFSVEKVLAGSFSIFEARETEKVRLLLDPLAARIAGERKWHPSQNLHPQPDGSAELTLDVGIAPDLVSWILSWGHRARVLEPEHLANRIGAEQQSAAAQYNPPLKPSEAPTSPEEAKKPAAGIEAVTEAHLL